MTRYHGKQVVKGGFYWNPKKWEVAVIEGENGVLPGKPEARFVRVPALPVILLGPVMGLVYVIFLPFIGFAMVLGLAFAKLLPVLRKLARPVTKLARRSSN